MADSLDKIRKDLANIKTEVEKTPDPEQDPELKRIRAELAALRKESGN